MNKSMASMYFYRCSDCLSVFTTSEAIKHYYESDSGFPRYGKCGACGGRIEFMGRTERSRLVRDSERCPCDARCTSARGPSCDCQCGGENHGSNLWVPITVDAGGIPIAHVSPQASQLADKYRDLVAQVTTALWKRYGSFIEAKRRGEYLSGAGFSLYLEGARRLRALHSAKELRSHNGRNKKLEAILREVAA